MARVGLALSGGAARGLAHIGVLKALQEESIPVDLIAGTSAGAAVAAVYARNRDISLLEEMALQMDWKKLARLVDPNLMLLGKGFLQGHKVKSLLAACLGGDIKFQDLEIPLAVVATDVRSMEEVVIVEGSVVEAVRASISLPVVFTPVKWGGRFLIDGGVVNPLPADVVRRMGADVVIAVNVLHIAQPGKPVKGALQKQRTAAARPSQQSRTASLRKRIAALLKQPPEQSRIWAELRGAARARLSRGRARLDPETPGIFEVLMQLMHALQYEKARLAGQYADLVVYPDVSQIRAFDFPRAEQIISRGYKAARQMIPGLKEILRSAPVSSSPPER